MGLRVPNGRDCRRVVTYNNKKHRIKICAFLLAMYTVNLLPRYVYANWCVISTVISNFLSRNWPRYRWLWVSSYQRNTKCYIIFI